MFDRRCTARVGSADAGLYFDASITYGWTLTAGAQDRILHPDEVARSLLVGAVRAATIEHPALHVQEAEWAANGNLSQEITTDDRVTVRGRVSLGLTADTEARARTRFRVSESARLQETERTVRLEAFRERVLSQGLGLTWWLEQYGGPKGTESPRQWAQELVESYEEVAGALHRDRISVETEEGALLRGRIEETLALVKDPAIAKRFAYHLGDYITYVVGGGIAVRDTTRPDAGGGL
ncbi:hypothetical protein ABZ234_29705 [Nocardiopsis sp. NPDC006198]|uniref:hypothetical protein n=1 Tax=Nocardiopsis sp. NPDC006198 TaxID=3154472 RepID=UPI0033BB89D0